MGPSAPYGFDNANIRMSARQTFVNKCKKLARYAHILVLELC